jgi:hypothetical protein
LTGFLHSFVGRKEGMNKGTRRRVFEGRRRVFDKNSKTLADMSTADDAPAQVFTLKSFMTSRANHVGRFGKTDLDFARANKNIYLYHDEEEIEDSDDEEPTNKKQYRRVVLDPTKPWVAKDTATNREYRGHVRNMSTHQANPDFIKKSGRSGDTHASSYVLLRKVGPNELRVIPVSK